MDATAALSRLLVEWRRLTDRESQALISGDWCEVPELQSRKAQLQAEIQRLLAPTGATPFGEPHRSRGMEGKFDSTVSELITLERRNGDLLAEKRKCRLAESERLALTLRDLQGVRRAYGPSRGPRWQSYS
jgi:hypothetical protein